MRYDFPIEDTLATMAQLKRAEPELYSLFFHRLYNGAERFADYREPLAFAASTVYIQDARRQSGVGPPPPESSMHVIWPWIQKWLEHDLPMHFVSPGLFDAMAHTIPPENFPVNEFHFPHPAMCFIFPKGALEFDGHEVGWAGLVRVDDDFNIKTKAQAILGINNNREHGFAVISQLNGTEQFIATFVPQRILNEYIRKNNFEDLNKLLMAEGFTCDYDSTEEAESATPFFIHLVRICLNLLLAMEIRPELVERARLVTQSKKGERKEFWTPNVLGQKYRVRIEGGVAQGSHASPRAHWRVGHYRMTGIGKRLCGCARPGCGHQGKLHAPECLVADCECTAMIESPRAFAEYRKDWREPVLVNAHREAA